MTRTITALLGVLNDAEAAKARLTQTIAYVDHVLIHEKTSPGDRDTTRSRARSHVNEVPSKTQA